MSTQMPIDSMGNSIPALRLKKGYAHTLSVTGTSNINASAFNADTRIISLYATSDIFINFGDNSVTASSSDHFFPAGIYYDIAIGGDNAPHYTHIAAIAASNDGTLYISEKE